MIDRSHALPVTKQAQALGISPGRVYYLPRPVLAADLAIMRPSSMRRRTSSCSADSEIR
jgi:hypothetical protein